jgi:hypothetical protein
MTDALQHPFIAPTPTPSLIHSLPSEPGCACSCVVLFPSLPLFPTQVSFD